MTKKSTKKDRVDVLVDCLDKYFFRFETAENLLTGSCHITGDDVPDDIRALFETARGHEARNRYYRALARAEKQVPGITDEIEGAILFWMVDNESFPRMLGFIMGLRIAGMSSEQTKQMARTWRLGYPQDDQPNESNEDPAPRLD